MNQDEQFWHRFGGLIRKVKGDCPLTPEQAQKELDALAESEEIPFSSAEIEKAIEKVLDRDFEPDEGTPDPGWVDSYSNSVEEDIYSLNRNKGESDPEVDAKVDELRKRAVNDEEDDEQDAAGLEDPKEPS